MPELASSAPGPRQKYILPSTKDKPEAEQAWVILQHGGIEPADMFGIRNMDSQFAFGVEFLAVRIIEWNLTENGVPAPITQENVLHMSGKDTIWDDIKYLIDQLQDDMKTTSDLESDPKKNELSSAI